jgi:hypothetical protein
VLFNLPQVLLTPVFDAHARPITVTPFKSQPGVAAYSARGYYGEDPIDVIGESGSILSDNKPFLDIIANEFPVLPMQGDQIDLPAHQGLKAQSFYINDLDDNGIGMITLTLRKLVTFAAP